MMRGNGREKRECERRRRLTELEEHHGMALPQQKRWQHRHRAATLLLLALGLGAAKAVGGTSIAGGGDSGWWSWAQNVFNGGRRQANAVAGGEGGGGAANTTNTTAARLVPYIAGLWEFTYEYAEITGPRANLETNPCFGPFPYRYTWNVYIWQKVADRNGTRVTTGDIRVCMFDREECQGNAKAWKIIESDRDLVDSKCRFAAYDEHPTDWFRYPGYMKGGYQKQLVPTDKDNKEVPVRTFDAFKTPTVKPWVWGIFCQQFSWFDGKVDVKNTPMPLYEGTWRHDNETWVILRDIQTCPCHPACRGCEELIPGTALKQVIESDGGACLAKYNVKPSDCKYVIRGVSGGPVRYPSITTGKDKADNGEDDQVCFAYATIKGKRKKGPELLPEIRDRLWDGMGIAADNKDPQAA